MRGENGLLFGGLTPVCVDTLKAVPMLLESTDERVRRRLLPDTYGDAEQESHWRRHGRPELERLFLSRAQLVRRDLKGLRRLARTDTWVLPVPESHTAAWLSSLNAARLALFELNELTAADMEPGGFERCTRKQREAVFRIHFLAEVQSFLLGDIAVDEDDFLDDGEFVLEEDGD